MKRFLVLIVFIFFIQPVFSQDFNDVKYIRNHDGDTIIFDLGDNLPDIFRYTPVRVYGIDTPEIKTKNACEMPKAIVARDFVKNELTPAKLINLIDCKKDKYNRIDCTVNYDNKDLTKELLKRGYGYEYFGGKKEVIDYSK